jgi:bacterial/archaeal transporter family-2 protein
MSRALALVATLITGGLVAAQPPANELLSRHVSVLGAAFVSLALSTLIVGVLLVFAGDPSALSGLQHFRPVHALGALGGAAIVTVTIVAVRHLGAGGVTAALVTVQLTVSVVLDRLGLLGLEGHAISLPRVAGIGLLFLGTWLVVAES